MTTSDLQVTTAGIRFSVQPGFRFGSRRNPGNCSCFVSNETLDELASRRDSVNGLPEAIFRQYEREITGVATRLALAGVTGMPLVVRYENFSLARR